MDKLRVGFVGLGGICRSRHVPGLRNIQGVEIAAVANRTRESSERAAAEFGIPIVCGSWQELVARDDLDVAVIGTWPYLHRPVALAALEAGKHVFCQARMAMNYAEAREMWQRAQASDKVTGLCPVPIGMAIDRTLDRLLEEDFLGEIRLVRVQSFADAYVDPDAPMNWRKDHRLSGRNMLTLGMYIEVIHRWFGWTRNVSAHTDVFVPQRVDGTGAAVDVQIPDQILFHAQMQAGFAVQYVFNAAAHHGSDRIEIYGSEGTLHYEPGTERLTGAQAGGAMQPIDIPPGERYDLENWSVERDFIAAIREGAEYHPDFEDGRRYMQVIDAVYESAAQGRTVTLTEDSIE
jgi:predicted dehydrogenase